MKENIERYHKNICTYTSICVHFEEQKTIKNMNLNRD